MYQDLREYSCFFRYLFDFKLKYIGKVNKSEDKGSDLFSLKQPFSNSADLNEPSWGAKWESVSLDSYKTKPYIKDKLFQSGTYKILRSSDTVAIFYICYKYWIKINQELMPNLCNFSLNNHLNWLFEGHKPYSSEEKLFFPLIAHSRYTWLMLTHLIIKNTQQKNMKIIF